MTTVTSPLAGRAIGLAAVPDPVFSTAMMGAGTAIDPVRRRGVARSPVAGVVACIHPHTFVVVDEEGRGILTHLGVDTVQLGGAGFETLVGKGDTVTRGQALVRWDPARVETAGRPPVCPVIALQTTAQALTGVVEHGDVTPADRLFLWR